MLAKLCLWYGGTILGGGVLLMALALIVDGVARGGWPVGLGVGVLLSAIVALIYGLVRAP
jgi:hypothetical protein